LPRQHSSPIGHFSRTPLPHRLRRAQHPRPAQDRIGVRTNDTRSAVPVETPAASSVRGRRSVVATTIEPSEGASHSCVRLPTALRPRAWLTHAPVTNAPLGSPRLTLVGDSAGHRTVGLYDRRTPRSFDTHSLIALGSRPCRRSHRCCVTEADTGAYPTRPLMLRLGYKASAEQFGRESCSSSLSPLRSTASKAFSVSDHFQPWRHSDGSRAFRDRLARCQGERTRGPVGHVRATPTFGITPRSSRRPLGRSLADAGRIILASERASTLNEVRSHFVAG